MTMRRASKAREQAELPAGYQFGDAGAGARVILLEADEFITGTLPKGTTVHVKPWRAPHLNAADVLQMVAARDRLNALPVPKRSAEDLAMIAEVNGWNVIEGEPHE